MSENAKINLAQAAIACKMANATVEGYNRSRHGGDKIDLRFFPDGKSEHGIGCLGADAAEYRIPILKDAFHLP